MLDLAWYWWAAIIAVVAGLFYFFNKPAQKGVKYGNIKLAFRWWDHNYPDYVVDRFIPIHLK